LEFDPAAFEDLAWRVKQERAQVLETCLNCRPVQVSSH